MLINAGDPRQWTYLRNLGKKGKKKTLIAIKKILHKYWKLIQFLSQIDVRAIYLEPKKKAPN
jgi:hypothetical protein